MARKEPRKAKGIKLRQPDRSGPTEKTLLDIARERDLFGQADEREREIKRPPGGDGDDEEEDEPPVLSPGAERILEALLWTVSMAMLHLTFDVLVQHQYGEEVNWRSVYIRTGRAWAVFLLLFYPLHPHDANTRLLPGLPMRYQKTLWQAVFFVMSAVCGSYLIHISNTYGYLAVMKQAPPLGVLWVWSVIELDLAWAVASLAVAGGFLWHGGYKLY